MPILWLAASKNMMEIRHSIDSLSALQDSMGIGNLSDYKASAMTTFRLTESDSMALASLKIHSINVDSVFSVSSRAQQLDFVKAMQSTIVSQKSALTIRGINMFQGDRNIRIHWLEWMKSFHRLCQYGYSYSSELLWELSSGKEAWSACHSIRFDVYTILCHIIFRRENVQRG